MKKVIRMLPGLAAVLALCCMLFCGTAAADDSTTTDGTAYKSLDANTEIYMVTNRAGTDYPAYGAKYEPTSGVYYGRVALGGEKSDGTYGAINDSELSGESIVSQYYSLTDSYSLEYWSYMFQSTISDGKHALLIQLNFENEAADCTAVVAGKYDAKLIRDFQYLSTLTCPVFVRIGGEMNVWTDMPAAADYIAAYRHIADLARSYASNAALVFSPNYTSRDTVDMDSFYPGDSYVDWVGASVFFNCYSNNEDNDRDEFYGVGDYGDAMLNVQQVVNLSRLHEKPVMITECGTAWSIRGMNVSSFAAERLEKAYAYLTMVYPEIKAIVYSDTNFVKNAKQLYQLHGNSLMTGAYEQGVESNPTLLSSCTGSASYYTKADQYDGVWRGTVSLAAYTYSSQKLTATWYVDGVRKLKSYEYPYSYSLSCTELSEGTHTVTVKFSNGEEKSVSFTAGTTDGWAEEDGNTVYYEAGTPVTGWKQISNQWYYFNDSGYLQTGWVKSGGSWYYCSDSGVMQTGWQQVDGKWYYLKNSMKTGWQQIDGKWYYLNTDKKTGWQKISSKWYYLGTDGVMQTGWQQIDGKWYYLSSYMKTGWQKVDGKWYYLNTDMKTGWQKISSKWYYLGTDGAMQTGWLTLSGKTYYLDTNGVMVTGTKTIDGKTYVFGSNGVKQ